ncbi:MAG TPA: ABC transporter permease, partial [Gemmatimonadaceae bacterium]
MSLFAFLRRSRHERDMNAEMRFHVDMEAEELERSGVPHEEARRQALARFGGVTRYREEGLEARGGQTLDDLWRDVRYSVRSLLRSPGYTAVVVGTLALGIAANASIFSVANGVLFKSLPWHRPDKLFLVGDKMDFWGVSEAMVTGPEIVRLRNETRRFDGFTAFRTGSVNLGSSDGAEPMQVPSVSASANLFRLLGAGPEIGRGFAPNESQPGAPRVAVISHRLFVQRFGADSSVVGKRVLVDGAAATIIGVLPSRFDFTGQRNGADVVMPMADTLSRTPRTAHMFMVLARVRDNAPVRDAQAELNALGAKLNETDYGKNGFSFMTLSLQERLVRRVRPAIITLLGRAAP